MLALLFAAALALQDAPIIVEVTPQVEPPRPEDFVVIDALPLEQAAAVRCAITFATIGRWQKAGDARGAAYPDMEAAGGREFFVQAMAKLMDDTGLSRAAIMALTFREVANHDNPEGEARIKALMPACELMKSTAGL